MHSTTVVCLLLLALVALTTALPTRGAAAESIGRQKKWYNWNDPQEMPSKKWYDWQDMPAADKIKRGGGAAFGGLNSAELHNYRYHPENPFEFNFGRL